ncbi:conserved hypothetical protein [Hahella chejuensis KCTC 2396]|uniref:DUF547 domain-containing protein n=1 Tax=Hahella chejuensis (strain KCTC 2396) TaxID=349521 RepID=Q2SN49_HAHCH|nr:DUF547 domain-containing protein [Hahella chejuensis]ABC27925.1 conserved hypothetical protein [Hahella chejuensis KCTC 2396]
MRINLRSICFLCIAFSVFAASAKEPDWSAYSELLQQYVKPDHKEYMDANFVDYGALKGNEKFSKLVEQIADFPLSDLETPEERMAFYLNGYNILAIKMVVDNWPIVKLKSLGSFFKPVWTFDAGILCGERVTLRYLEHEILRKMGDPRIHMALNCASMSCPDLRIEPYTASKLHLQLEDQSKKYLMQDNKGITVEKDVIHLSSIFGWFEDDFEVVGGVEAFVRKHRQDLPEDIKFSADLPYNWNVNAILNRSELKKALAKND